MADRGVRALHRTHTALRINRSVGPAAARDRQGRPHRGVPSPGSTLRTRIHAQRRDRLDVPDDLPRSVHLQPRVSPQGAVPRPRRRECAFVLRHNLSAGGRARREGLYTDRRQSRRRDVAGLLDGGHHLRPLDHVLPAEWLHGRRGNHLPGQVLPLKEPSIARHTRAAIHATAAYRASLPASVHAEKAANGIPTPPATATIASPRIGTHDSSSAGCPNRSTTRTARACVAVAFATGINRLAAARASRYVVQAPR